jgi:hypothetical protein
MLRTADFERHKVCAIPLFARTSRAGADTGFWVSAIPKELSFAVKPARQSLRDRRLHKTEVCASPAEVMERVWREERVVLQKRNE